MAIPQINMVTTFVSVIFFFSVNSSLPIVFEKYYPFLSG